MSLFDTSSLVGLAGWMLGYATSVVKALLINPGGDFAIASLIGNLVVALSFVAWRQRKTRTGVRLVALARAVFPRRTYLSRSAQADFKFVFFNLFLFGLLFGWALLSSRAVATAVNHSLTAGLGAMPAVEMPVMVGALVDAVVLFLAFEFGYWLNHYLSHRSAFLWEFHKLHHTAEVLTPLTNFRVHPVYTVVFLDIVAVVMGMTEGGLSWLLGRPLHALSIFNVNAFMLISTYLIGHLQHSHFWIPFTGWMGKLIISPAHHQIHHSTNPAHFNTNYGSTLAVFDWLFGTLHMPTAERERLSFGLAEATAADHTLWGGLYLPVLAAWGRVRAGGASTVEGLRGLTPRWLRVAHGK